MLGGALAGVLVPAAYAARFDALVARAAGAAGEDPERALARFAWCRERLGRESSVAAALGTGAEGAASVAVPYELVLVFAARELAGYGYLTQGPVRATLFHGTAELLAGAARVLLESGGASADAALLATAFRLSFPEPRLLARYSPLAMALVVGVVPRGDGFALKAYFNTRLDASAAHAARVLELARLAGVDAATAYQALYAGRGGADFLGVGLDVGASAGRAKVYVRVPLGVLERTLAEAARDLPAAPWAELERVVARLVCMPLAPKLELAVGLRPGCTPSLKATAYFAAGSTEARAGASALLAEHGYDPGALATVLGDDATLGALGVEVSTNAPLKLSAYVTPG